MKQFNIELAHDNGHYTINVRAETAKEAISTILTKELAPKSAIKVVKEIVFRRNAFLIYGDGSCTIEGVDYTRENMLNLIDRFKDYDRVDKPFYLLTYLDNF